VRTPATTVSKNAAEGILLIDKPAGITSHDVVAAVRRALDGTKTGHAGTLDPFATGLLIVLVGRATKAQRQMMELRKRYTTIAQLGAISSTGDTEGAVTVTGRLPPDPPPMPTGEIKQRPPQYSAVKVGGERAYKRARRGEQFELPERIVSVYRFEQLWRGDQDPVLPGYPACLGDSVDTTHSVQPKPSHSRAAGLSSTDESALERAGYEIECSAGTYVRSLIAELGDAYCLELRRTAIGPFEVGQAVGPPRRGEPWRDPPLIALDQALARLPK
jgi:tRNA pseudouridine55 synthase